MRGGTLYRLNQNRLEPTHVAEILAMSQSGVLRVHAEANLETAREINTVGQFERVVVAFTRDNVHRNSCAEMLASVAVGDDDHIDADGVVQTLFVDAWRIVNGSPLINCPLRTLAGSVGTNDAYVVPARSYGFLPRRQLLGRGIVFSQKVV